MWRPAFVTVVAAVGIAVACDLPTYSCAGVGYWALDIAIRDAQGNPQALGAVVTLYDGDYREENMTTCNPGVSRALTWRIVGDTSSVTLEGSTGTLRYRCLPTSGYLKLVAQSVADSTVVAMTDIAVQGHPAATNDPPCP